MDRILFWNSRSASSDKFRSSIQELVKMNNVDILFICEPRIQFEGAKKFLLSLGFTDFVGREANGFSGGIWLLWNKNKVDIDIVDSNFQSISVKVSWIGSSPWLLTGVYASPYNTSRSSLWSYFDSISQKFGLPWVLLGDFNELLSYADKIGGSNHYRFGGMRDWVSRNGLVDLRYQDADYTWSNNVVKERRRRNKIDGLYDANGVWTTDMTGIQQIAVDFFRKLFTAEPVEDLRVIIPSLFPEIPDADMVRMNRPITERDIHSALFRIAKFKAPGVDGFPALFFQRHWNLCAAEIISVVTQASSSGSVPPSLNHTLITLVPKFPSPQDMQFFRPISLCCTVYKIISKIFVDRVRPLLRKWISPNQVSFVPGRHISDNIMIAQELLHKCKNSKGVKGFMAWKVDLSKAYDKLNWNFIEQVLNEVKLPTNFVKIIMSSVSTASYQIIVNGELSNSFSGSRGIRQGDPLSPYLFILCMEKLSHSIQNAVEMGHWKPIQSSHSGPRSSHLFFADDWILFSEASSTQATVMKGVMNLFCNLSDLGVYLGMPLIHSRVFASAYANLVDKVQSRLASWKSKTLNMAGRLTLIQSVASSIPVYAMQTAKLPISICDSLDRLNRNFLWGDTDQLRKVHLTNWDMENNKKPTKCSSTWSGIVFGADLVNGCTIKFWTDKWSPCGILKNLAFNHDIDLHAVVKDFWIGRMWNVDMLMVQLPTDVVHVITTIPIAVGDLLDKIIWGKTSSGIFSVKSAYQLICDESGYQKDLIELTGNSSCKHCVGIPETMLHLFRDCPKARLFANLMQNGYHIHNLSWNVFFVFCCWFIWKWRCKSIFDDRYQYPCNPADIILGYATDWTKAMAKPNMQLLKHVKNLSWIKPVDGFYKLNVDGSRSRNGDIGWKWLLEEWLYD
ncbi:hypothetical protein ACLB2K_029398 [Fragaria x ananassa]